MNAKDAKIIFNHIADTHKLVQGLIAKFGEKDLCEVLNNQFGLSRQDSRQLLHIAQDMVEGVPHDALPGDWFFKPAPSQMSTGILKKHKSEIRRQREDVQYTIEKFRKLSDEQRDKVLYRWPKKYWDMLQEKPVDIGDERYDKLPASIMANIIIAERYNSKWSTIESYCK